MKILSYLNVSNISNLEADSGYVFQRSILEELYKSWHQVVFVGPSGMPNLGKEIITVEMNFSDSKYGVRFGLNWEELKIKLSPVAQDVDIILVNQSELAVQISTLLYEITGRKIPCVTYYHYLAVQEIKNNHVVFDPSLDHSGIAKFIWQRQVESALFSDKVIVGSDFGRNLFLKASGCDDLIREKMVIIPPPVQDFDCQKSCLRNSIPILFYNHRLYDHYGGLELFKLLEGLQQQGCEFKVIVTDPTQKRSIVREKLDDSVRSIKNYLESLSFVEICHYKTQSEYYGAINNIDIGFAPFRNGALWSMATADVMSLGKPVLAPNKGAFPKILKDQDLLFNSEKEFCNILMKLLQDSEYRGIKGLRAKERSKNFSSEHIAEKFEDVLLNTIKESKAND